MDWSVFGTLTFAEVVSESRAMDAAESLLKWVAHIDGTKYRRLVYVIRLENGERTGRLHLHLLLVVKRRSMGYFVVAQGRTSQARNFWKRYGISTWRSVEAGGDSVVAYITKDIDAGADIYELAKTARTQHELSLSATQPNWTASISDTTLTQSVLSKCDMAVGGGGVAAPALCLVTYQQLQ
jgi:hypothetical protein